MFPEPLKSVAAAVLVCAAMLALPVAAIASDDTAVPAAELHGSLPAGTLRWAFPLEAEFTALDAPEPEFHEIPPAESGVFPLPEQELNPKAESEKKENTEKPETGKKSGSFLELLFKPVQRENEEAAELAIESSESSDEPKTVSAAEETAAAQTLIKRSVEPSGPDTASAAQNVSKSAVEPESLKKAEKKQAAEASAAESRITESPNLSGAAVESLEEYSESAVVREIYIYVCPGEGWLLEGYTDAGGEQTSRVRYSGRQYLDGQTVFSFYPYRTGSYVINLRKNDYSTGTIQRIRLSLEIVDMLPEQDEDAEIAPALLPDNDSEAAPAAVHAYTAENSGTAEQGNTQPPGEDKPPAGAPDSVMADLSAEDAVAAAERLEGAGDCRGAAELLSESLGKMNGTGLDELYFKLAELYETCPGIRDERTAAEIYRKIVDDYPVSTYWMKAKERVKYLERNFLYIR